MVCSTRAILIFPKNIHGSRKGTYTGISAATSS